MKLNWYQEQISQDSSNQPMGWLIINGPLGTVRARDIGWITDNYYDHHPDRLDDLYILLIAVNNGFYHCCLTGKVWFTE